LFEFLKRWRGGSGREEFEKKGVGYYLPTLPTGGFSPVGRGLYGETIPYTPLDFATLYMVATHSPEVYGPINALIREALRSGVQIVPKYRWLCLATGVEYDDRAEALEYCPSDQLVQPNEQEYLILEKWLSRMNDYGETLTEVLKQFLFDLNVLDNAYLVAIYDYEFSDSGDVVGAELKGIYRGDARFMRIVMNKHGRYGETDAGRKVWFCPNDRENVIETEQDEEPPLCPGGIKPFPAWFAFVKPGSYSNRIFYAPWEVLHVKKFFPGAGYGYPPLIGLMYKILALMYMDYFIYTAFKKDRAPPGLLILRGHFESIWKAWEKLKDEARTNPHAIYPIVIEDFDLKGDVAKWIDLSIHPKEYDMIELRRELRRVIAAVYGVSPVFYESVSRSQDATSGFIVTNRAVEFEQRILNEKVLPWIVKRIGVRSYTYMLAPPEIRDRKTELDMKRRVADIVAILRRMGFDARIRQMDDGSWDIIIEGDPPPGMLGEQVERALRNYSSSPRRKGSDGDENPEVKRSRERERYYAEAPGNQPGTRYREEDQRFEGEPER